MRPSGPGASGAPSSIGRIDALDGIRAVAILGVLGWHANQHLLRGGHLGVAVFFTLSGFLITTLLLDEHRATGRVDLRRFYRRRFARLLPALLVAVAASAALGAASPWVATARQLVVSIVSTLTYTSNVVAALSRNAMTDVLSWSWSLSLEEQFYLLWPGLCLLGLRGMRQRRTLVWGTAALYVGLAVWRVVLAGGFDAQYRSRVYYGPDTRVDAVLVGCLLALWLHRRARCSDCRPVDGDGRGGSAAMLAMLTVPAFVLLVALLAVGGPVPVLFLAALQLTPLLTAAVIAGVVSGPPDALVRSALSWRPLVWLGRRSYSVYLWNAFFYYATPAPVARHWMGWGVCVWVVLTLTAAHLSYRYVEQPFLRLVRPSGATSAAPSPAAGHRAVQPARPLTAQAMPSAAGP
jgi:peptidoglycan/LPS O-acetylase OafA/YrhL